MRNRGPKPGPLAAGVDLAAGMVRAVTVRREDTRLRVTGSAGASIPPSALRGGLVIDRAAVAAAIGRALRDAERGERAQRVVVALDADDIRTFHLATTFERDAPRTPISEAELARATREAKLDLAQRARAAAAEDAALRAVPTAELREDLAAFVLDGRPLVRAAGFQGRFLDVRADVAIAPLVVSGAAIAALEAAGREGTLAAGGHVLGRLMLAAGADDVGLVRLGPDLTTVTVLRAGAVALTRTFSLGRDELLARGREPDGAIWAFCVLEALGSDETPERWLASGVPPELAALPEALRDALAERRGGPVEVAPLRAGDVARVLMDAALLPDELVAAGAAAVAAGVTV